MLGKIPFELGRDWKSGCRVHFHELFPFFGVLVQVMRGW